MSALPPDLPAQVARSLAEDVGSGDVTAALVPPATVASATLLSREPAVVCGIPWVDETFRQLDPAVHIDWHVREGERVAANTILCDITGPARPILTGERTALNFLQTLSGTATAVSRYVDAVAGTGCRILDTRKTLPGLRLAQKYAVRIGGGQNHRIGLHDMVLIKENHIMAAGSIAGAIAAAIALNRAAARPAKLEASGGVDLDTVRRIASTGVDYISVGSLTKHLHATDLSLRFTLS